MEGWAEVWDHQLGTGALALVFLGLSVALVKKAGAEDKVSSLGYAFLALIAVAATLIFGVRSLLLLL